MACKYKYKDKWYSETEIKNQIIKDISLDDVIVELSTQISYTVEINTAKEANKLIDWENNPNTTYFEFTVDNIRYTDSTYGYYYKRLPNTSKDVEISEEEYNKAKIKSSKNPEAKPTSYYSNLTVPGGTNYTENEIAIPGVEVQEKPQGVEKKEGVDFVFEQNPELANIGTPAQYSQYLDTIFPDSKVKDIVYHHSDTKLTEFKKEFPEGYAAQKGVSSKAKFFLRQPLKEEFLSKRPHVGQYLINTINPNIMPVNADRSAKRDSGIKEGIQEALNNNQDGAIFDNIWDNRTWSDVLVVFEPEQIHILGGKQDVEGFKNFIKSNTKTVRKGAITPSIKGHAQFSTSNGIGWFRSDESQQYQDIDIQNIIDNLQKSGQLEINCK